MSKKSLQKLLRQAAIDCLQAETYLENSDYKPVLRNLKRITKNLTAVTQNIKV